MTEKTHMKVIFIGFGNVGQKIADILVELYSVKNGNRRIF